MNRERYFHYVWKTCVIAIFSTVLLWPKISNVFSAILVLSTVWYSYENNTARKRFSYVLKTTLFLILFFLVGVLSLLWTDGINLTVGVKHLETQLSLFVFPIVISVIEITKKDIEQISFMTLVILLSIFLCFSLYIYMFDTDVFSVEYLLDSLFELAHRTYVSMYLLVFGFITFLNLANSESKRKKYLGYGLLTLTFVTTQLFESRIAVLCIPILIAITFFYLRERIDRVRIAISSFLVMTILLVAIIPNSERALGFLAKYQENIENGDYHKIEDRIIVWLSVKEAVFNNLLIGVGTGDAESTVLQSCIDNTPNLRYTNVHNQYLDTLVRLGMVGLIVILAMLLIPLILALRQKDAYTLCFITVVAVCFLTENIINRQMGVMFFAILNSMFYFNLVGKQMES